MHSARVIVCEKSGSWALALRGWLPAAQLEICQTRSLAESRERLGESPGSVVAVECSRDKVVDVCRWLRQAAVDFPQMRAVVLASPGLRAAECVWRTAGAHQVADSPLGLAAIAGWIGRHLEQVPRRPRSARQWTQDRMPWPRRRHGPVQAE